MSRLPLKARRLLVVACAVGAASLVAELGQPARAASGTWTGATDSTWAGANWSTTPVPGTGDTATFNASAATVNNNLTLDLGTGVTIGTILFDTANAAAYTIGSGAVGSQTLTLNNAGAITINASVTNSELFDANLVLGTDATAQAYTFTNNSIFGGELLTFAGNISGGTGGAAGIKTLNVAGAGNTTISGAITSGGSTAIALTKTGTGVLTLSNASNNITGNVNVAGGSLTLSGALGTNATNGQFRVGTAANVAAIMNILPGATITRFNLFVGDAGAGTGGGAVYQSGGTLSLTQGASIDNLRVGSNTGGYGYYSLSGTGTLTANEFGIGASLGGTVGVVDVTGGVGTSNGYITIGRGGTTSSGLLNVTGGTVNFGAVTVNPLALNWAATSGAISIVNVGGGATAAAITGGSTAAAGKGLNLLNSNAAGTQGVANLLTNGTLTVSEVTATGGANPTALLNFNGGTLKATATNTGATFMTSANIDAVTVYSLGGTIDNSGTAITIATPLLAPTGSGVNAVTVTNGGSGYIGAPMVKITGGAGSGATGYATVANGVVTGVTITSRGSGYLSTDSLTATFFGGAGSGAAATISAAQITANTSGGLTFSGTGTTTLTGISTFSGASSISGGTNVRLSGSGNLGGATVTVAGGASAATQGTLTLVNGAINASSAGGMIVGGTSGNHSLLNFDVAASTADLLSLGSGVFTENSGGANITLTLLAGGPSANQTLNLITFGSGGGAGFALGTGATVGSLTLTNPPSLSFGVTGQLKVTSTAVQLVTTGTAAPTAAYWSGVKGTLWTSNDGVGGNFTTDPGGVNFVGAFPNAATDVIFTANGNGAPTNLTNTLGQDFEIKSLTFSSATSVASNISGANTLIVDGGGITVQSGNGGATLGMTNLALGAPQTWSNASAVNLAVSSVISGGAASGLTINNTSTGATVLSGANTFTGGLTLTAGLLQPSGAGTLGATSGQLTVNGGTLDLNGTSQSVGNFTGSGGTVLNNGTTNASFTIGTGGGTGGVYQGVLADNNNAGTGTIALTKTGAGTIALAGANTYSGVTNINGGALQVQGAETAGTSGPLGKSAAANPGSIVFGGGTLQYSATNQNDYSGRFSVAANQPISVDTNGQTVTFATALTSAGGTVAKLGTGTLILSGANTYTGVTRVKAGAMTYAGSLAAGNTIYVGDTANSNAVLNLTGTVSSVNMFVGDAGAGTGGGAVYQSSGSFTATQAAGIDNLRIGSNATGYGYYNLSGTGTLIANEMGIGGSLNDTVGILEVTGGTATSTGYITLGRGGATSSGLLNVIGGTVNFGTTAVNPLALNWAGTAGAISIVNVGGGATAAAITGGSTNAATKGLNLADTNIAGTQGIANLLTNGTLTVSEVAATGGPLPTALLNFNGGTLKATATNTGANFMTSANIDAVTVYSGGGTIDNNGTAITIGTPLLAPAGSGLSGTSIAVASGGSGYIGAPLVKLTGGTGAGATGYAVISGGVVTNIVVTSPGSGYAAGDTLTATFFGGGAAVAATNVSGIPVAANNTTGGLAFLGTGTTTLTGANTYAGPTTITGGILSANTGSLGGTAVTVGAGGTLLASGNYTVGTSGNGKLALAAGNGTLSLIGSTLNTLTINNATAGATALTVGGGNTLNFEVGDGVGDQVALGSGLAATATGTNTVNITLLARPSATQTLTLIRAPGGFTGSSNFNLGTVTGTKFGLSFALNPTPTELQLIETAGAAPAVAYFVGNQGASWSANDGIVANFSSDSAGTVFTTQLPGTGTDVHMHATNADPAVVAATTLDGSFTIKTLTVDGSTLNESDAVGIGPGAVAGSILTIRPTDPATGITVNSGAGAVTVSAAVAVGAPQTWTNNSSNLLTVSGPVSNGTSALTVAGSGNTTISGLVGSGTGALIKSDAGILTLSGANTFTGDVNVNGGTLIANRSNNVANPVNSALGNPQVARNINVNNGGTLQFNQGDTLGGNTTSVVATLVINAGGTVTNNGSVFTTLGPVQLNGGTLTGTGGAVPNFQMYSLQGPVTVTGSTPSTISGSGSNAGYHLSPNTTFNVGDVTGDALSDLNASGTFVDRQAALGAGAITKTGPGTMTLSSANSYSGGTTVSGGALVAAADGALGTGPVTVTSGSLTQTGGTTNDYIADTANLILSAGTVDNLNYTGTDTIKSLFLAGVGEGAGVYGALGNPAVAVTNQSSLFGTYDAANGIDTGTVTVTVATPEPACLSMLGLVGLLTFRRRRRT